MTGASPGEFFSFMTAFLLAYEPAKRLARLNHRPQQRARRRARAVRRHRQPAERAGRRRHARRSCSATRASSSRDVSFAYRPDEPVLRNLSFVAEPGRVTALVGPSGGGKSTILNLILRFYEAERGEILIDGQDIAHGVARIAAPADRLCGPGRVPVPRLDPRQHRVRPAGRRPRPQIVAAAKAAFAHDFIMGFPQRLRHAGRRARAAAVGRPAPARRDRARADQGRADHPARRGDRRARQRVRAPGAAGDRAAHARAAPRS